MNICLVKFTFVLVHIGIPPGANVCVQVHILTRTDCYVFS